MKVNFDEIKKLVNKRTAYTDEQLREATKQDSLVILFKHYLTFEKELTYKDLLNMGVISSGIQQIQKIDLETGIIYSIGLERLKSTLVG